MPRFKCPCCDKWYDEFPQPAFRRPDAMDALSPDEQKQRVRSSNDLCVIDGQSFYIRCILPMTMRGEETVFPYGVWVKVSREFFQRYFDHYDDDMSGWPTEEGFLANDLPQYPTTMDLALTIRFQVKGRRPEVFLKPMDHPLVTDQEIGIPVPKAMNIIAPFLAH